jgi:hypothetical protein
MSLRRAAAAVVLFAAATAAHAQFVINEGFNNVATLAGSGWILSNASAPLGSTPGWFQGDQTIFTSQAGAPQAYLAANYNNAAAGGTLANWLISPTFSTQDAGVVSFYVRAEVVPESATSSSGASARVARASPTSPSGRTTSSAPTGRRFRSASLPRAPARPAGSRSSTPALPTSPTTSASTRSPWRFRSLKPGRSCSPASPVWA